MEQIIRGLKTYSDKENRNYSHLVDGGITDNLGLRALLDVMELAGGPQEYYAYEGRTPPRYAAVISVNASTDPEPWMDRTNKQPSIGETINSMSHVELHRYNDATLYRMQEAMAQWKQVLSTPDRPFSTYFVKLGFVDIQRPEQRRFFNTIPTSFSLTREQVDKLVSAYTKRSS